jgi:G:T/U-mismatch repair DNA glycosylase
MQPVSKYKTLNTYAEEVHPWESYIPQSASKLILGTFPTAERHRTTYDFFYPNPNNDFWNVIVEVANKNWDDFISSDPVQLRKGLLAGLGLGISDIGYRVLRQKGSSIDKNLFAIEYRNVFLLLENNPSISKVILTSNLVVTWFHHYCELNNFNFIVLDEKLPWCTSFAFENRKIKIEVIASTSRASRIRGDKLVQMYKNAILND